MTKLERDARGGLPLLFRSKQGPAFPDQSSVYGERFRRLGNRFRPRAWRAICRMGDIRRGRFARPTGNFVDEEVSGERSKRIWRPAKFFARRFQKHDAEKSRSPD